MWFAAGPPLPGCTPTRGGYKCEVANSAGFLRRRRRKRRKREPSSSAGMSSPPGLLWAAGSTLAAPAIAQTQPSIRWRLTSSFPKSLETIYGGGEFFAERVNKLPDGKFNIRLLAAGDIVPAFQALDAVQQGTVELCHTATYYYVGKDFTMGFGTALPFGLTTRQQNAWMYHGGGIDTLNTFFKDYGVIAFPAGNTGAQMGGWFRNEVNTLADFKGLKMRIPGLGGQVMARIGAVPQALPG